MSTRSSAAALLAAVFFAGVAGTLGVLRVVENRPVPVEREMLGPEQLPRQGLRGRPGGPGPGSLRELARMEFTERLAERLGLSQDQRTRLEAVMEERREKTEALMESVVPALRSQTDSLQAEIEAILTDEQRAIYRRFAEEGRDRFRGRRRPGQQPPS